MLGIYPKEERDKLSLSPARHDVVICACGPQINMLEATKYNRGYLGIKVPGAGLEGLSRMPSNKNVNPKFLTLNFTEDIISYPAAISSHSTTTLVLPLHSLSIGQSCTPGIITKVNPMAGSLDSAPDSGLGAQDGNLGESVNEQLPETGDASDHVPGSDSFFGEGKFRFPKLLMEQGGSGILSNPMCHGMNEYLLSASVFDLTTSIEGVM